MPAPADLLPLPPHDFQVLLALAAAPAHAYALAQSVEAAEHGVRLELGSLYRILARLSAQGLIDARDPSPRAEGHEARRRYYRLTPFGRQVAEAEARRLSSVLGLARRRQLLPGRSGRS